MRLANNFVVIPARSHESFAAMLLAAMAKRFTVQALHNGKPNKRPSAPKWPRWSPVRISGTTFSNLWQDSFATRTVRSLQDLPRRRGKVTISRIEATGNGLLRGAQSKLPTGYHWISLMIRVCVSAMKQSASLFMSKAAGRSSASWSQRYVLAGRFANHEPDPIVDHMGMSLMR